MTLYEKTPPSLPMSESQRIALIRSGDTSAFAYFVDRYQEMALSIASRICRGDADAEDVVQESFVKAYFNLHTFRQSSKFSTWFYRIVYNTALTHSKAHIWEVRTEELPVQAYDQADTDGINSLDKRERQEIVRQVLDSMAQGEALLLTLFYLEEHSIKEIAEVTSLSESNVKVRLHRARKTFRELIHKLYKSEQYEIKTVI